MTTETIQQQLAKQISNHNKTWGNLLANLDFGNEASNYWDVTLEPINISIDNIKNRFTFKNAEFRFDVNSGIFYGDDHRVFIKYVSGKEIYQFTDNKTIHLTELKIEK